MQYLQEEIVFDPIELHPEVAFHGQVNPNLPDFHEDAPQAQEYVEDNDDVDADADADAENPVPTDNDDLDPNEDGDAGNFFNVFNAKIVYQSRCCP